jgi:hypothetical protein
MGRFDPVRFRPVDGGGGGAYIDREGRMPMINRFAVPFVVLAVLFLPLPFVLSTIIFGVLLMVRPRGEPRSILAPAARFAGLRLLRAPPR